MWGGRARPRRTPCTIEISSALSMSDQADQGVGRGPGGPPHKIVATCEETKMSHTDSLILTLGGLGLGVVAGGLAAAGLGQEPDLFVTAQAAMRVEAFQNKLSGGGADGIRLTDAQTEDAGLFHQA